MGVILMPSNGPQQWKPFLAEPEKQWRSGYSAKSLAHCWESTQGDFPPELKQLFGRLPHLSGMELLLAVPEHRVPLPGGSRPSQNDIWVLGKTAEGLVSIAVEGKVQESFGPVVKDWQGAHPSPGKKIRLDYLCDVLKLGKPIPQTIRYQLLHRAASSIMEARRFHAPRAMMLVYSFSQTHEWLEDF